MNVKVLAVESEGILKLVVTRPMQHTRRALQARNIGVQHEILVPHVTLARLDELCVCLKKIQVPQPPEEIELEDKVYYVDSGEKQSTYVNVTPHSQGILALYLRKVEFIAEQRLYQPGRRFHVTLTNTNHGNMRSSVGQPWDYVSHPI